jgi:hypothetical protein
MSWRQLAALETLQWTMQWPDGAVAEFTTSYQQNYDHFRAEAPGDELDQQVYENE